MALLRDPYTAGHQTRVAALAAGIARGLQLSEFDVEGIEVAASLHDVGKLAVPSEILSAPRRLSAPEYELVKQHPLVGHDLLETIEFPWPVATMVLQHHERVDGSGYPDGLAGRDTLLGARIIAVADVVEAMTSHRPYRPGLGLGAAVAEIRANRGRAYDADVVDACVGVLECKT
jgi:putative nucleotidyltransferase with HDIG domain